MEPARGQHRIAISVLSAAFGALAGIGLLMVLSKAGDLLAAEVSLTGDASLDSFLQGLGLWPLMWVQAAIAPIFVIAGALVGLQVCERLRPKSQLEGWTCPYDPTRRQGPLGYRSAHPSTPRRGVR